MKNMIKAFVTDIDHTLYCSETDSIHPENIKALNRLAEAGIPVIIASSRTMYGTKLTAGQTGINQGNNYLISDTGALIYRCRDQKIIFEKAFDMKDVRELYQMSTEHGFTFNIPQDSIVLSNGYSDILKYDFTSVRMDIHLVHDLLSAVNKPVYRVSVSSQSAPMSPWRPLLEEQFGDRYNFHCSQDVVIDISLSSVDKTTAVKKILDELGIDMSETAVIGDGGNDVGLIRSAGLSAAVANACDEAKQYADMITASDHDGGAAEFINYFMKRQFL